MRIGLLRGNHTTVPFESNAQAIQWLEKASYDDLYPIEMAFVESKHLHKKYPEEDIDWKNRCVEFFRTNDNIQNFLIP